MIVATLSESEFAYNVRFTLGDDKYTIITTKRNYGLCIMKNNRIIEEKDLNPSEQFAVDNAILLSDFDKMESVATH